MTSVDWPLVSAPNADFPAALKGTDQTEDFIGALSGLEDVLRTQSVWLRDWHEYLFARIADSASTEELPPTIDPRAWHACTIHRLLHENASLRRAQLLFMAMLRQSGLVMERTATTRAVPLADYHRFMTTVSSWQALVRELQNEAWNRLANIDPLTGLANRAAMLRKLGIESERYARHGHPCCVAVVDIDHFKAINDCFGHGAGDRALKSIAGLLATSVRPYDEVFRYGGEEFVICLPSTDLRTSWAIAERLRLRVQDWSVPLADGQTIRATISIGIAPLTACDGVQAALETADRALYVAKRSGRNTIHVRDY